MGFNNPNMPWWELEATLSDRPSSTAAGGRGRDGRAPGSPSWNAGGDGPAWSRKRQPYQAPDPDATQPLHRPDSPAVPYAELHCHTNFSFLDGASHPEQLAEEASRLGLEALAITDHDGLYGVVRFAEAARAVGLPTVFGAEITLGTTTSSTVLSEEQTQQQIATGLVPDHHAPDPHGNHLL
ncbi:MAG: PHP domain-containing protein, partial [Ilumatobacteraceae bacterium]